jgi:hypothetical protein
MTEEVLAAIKARAKAVYLGSTGLGCAEAVEARPVVEEDVHALVAEVERLLEALTMSRSAHAAALDSLRQTERNNLRAAVRLRKILGAYRVEPTADAARRVVAERDALRTAILDLQHADAMASAHSEDCPGKAHVVGEDCGADGDGGWTCCEGLSREGCLAAERDRCNCGLVAWRAQMRAAGDLARGFRAVEVDL